MTIPTLAVTMEEYDDSLTTVILQEPERGDYGYLGADNNWTGENTFNNITVINYEEFNVTGNITSIAGYLCDSDTCYDIDSLNNTIEDTNETDRMNNIADFSCTGDDKVSSFGSDAVPSCTSDIKLTSSEVATIMNNETIARNGTDTQICSVGEVAQNISLETNSSGVYITAWNCTTVTDTDTNASTACLTGEVLGGDTDGCIATSTFGDNLGDHTATQSLNPDTDNSYTLGSTTNQWSTLYTDKISVSGKNDPLGYRGVYVNGDFGAPREVSTSGYRALASEVYIKLTDNVGGASSPVTGYYSAVNLQDGDVGYDIQNLYGMYGNILLIGSPYYGGTVTNAAGATVRVDFASINADITNTYGLWIQSLNLGSGTKYGIYDESGEDWSLDSDNQKIWLGEDKDTYIEWDGTNTIINTTTGNLQIKNNTDWGTIEYGNAIEHTYIYTGSGEDALELLEQAENTFITPEGKANYSAWGECHYIGEETDLSRPEIEFYNDTTDMKKEMYDDINSKTDMPTHWITNTRTENNTIIYEVTFELNKTIYPHKKLSEGVNTGCKQAVKQKAQKFQLDAGKPVYYDGIETPALEGQSFIADGFYTKSKVIDLVTNYALKFLDMDSLASKEFHKNKITITDNKTGEQKDLLSMEDRTVDLEGAFANHMTCLANHKKYEDYRACMGITG